jgi:hypothetical protein
MGLARKANKEQTSATSTSDESSCMPSEVAADISNSALEVR